MKKSKAKITRPMPPQEALEFAEYGPMVPDTAVVDWIQREIVSENGSLHNPDHAHLENATIGVLWAGSGNESKGRRVIGMAEIPRFMCNRWHKVRQEQQINDWFGCMPDFLITLDAHYCAEAADDRSFAALVEHELYHCGQATDEFGSPKFNQETGLPTWTIRGHDVEEFVGVVRRYGVGHPEGNLAQLVAAGNAQPEVANADISRACGTCLRAVSS